MRTTEIVAMDDDELHTLIGYAARELLWRNQGQSGLPAIYRTLQQTASEIDQLRRRVLELRECLCGTFGTGYRLTVSRLANGEHEVVVESLKRPRYLMVEQVVYRTTRPAILEITGHLHCSRDAALVVCSRAAHHPPFTITTESTSVATLPPQQGEA